METQKLLENIRRVKQKGDAVRVTRIVNARRSERGEQSITQQYVNNMLNGTRTMTKEVAEVADKYFKTQEEITKNLMA